jgi:hypothetical protein
MMEMRASGFGRILLGIETTNNHALAQFDKGIQADSIERATDILNRCKISMIPGFMMFNPYTTVSTITQDLEYLKKTRAYGVSLTKCLVVHQGTPIEDKLDAENRLLRRPILDGYHDYLVDPDVARIYSAGKQLYLHWLDPIESASQEIVNAIKRSEDFSDRHEYDQIKEAMWLAASAFIEKCLEWTKTIPSVASIVCALSDTESKLSEYKKLVERWNAAFENLIAPSMRRLYILDVDKHSRTMKVIDCPSGQVFELDSSLQEVVELQYMSNSGIIEQIQSQSRLPSRDALDMMADTLGPLWFPRFAWPDIPNREEIASRVLVELTKDRDPILREEYTWTSN